MTEREKRQAEDLGLVYKEKEDVPMIELHKVDTAMAYAARIVKDVKIIVGIFVVMVIAIVFIFVSKYNERTSDWLRTYNLLRTGETEVQNANTETIQQFPDP